jgi:arsenical resistance protein ArsH
VYNPEGLPMKDEASTSHPKVEEIRNLSMWSEAQVLIHHDKPLHLPVPCGTLRTDCR